MFSLTILPSNRFFAMRSGVHSIISWLAFWSPVLTPFKLRRDLQAAHDALECIETELEQTQQLNARLHRANLGI